MDLSYFVMEVLRKYSSPPGDGGPGPLNQEEIRKRMEEMFPFLKERLRPPPNPKQKKKPRSHVIRSSLEKLVQLSEALPEKEQFLRCLYNNGETGPVPGGGKRRIEGYWAVAPLSFRDAEIKLLIDLVLHSGSLPANAAHGLAKRLQQLQGTELRRRTSYVGGGFGKERIKVPKDSDLWNNLEVIQEAIEAQKQISFVLNAYKVKFGEIVLWPGKTHTLSPVELVLNNGRYYLLGVYEGKEKDYAFRVDLMTDVKKLDAPGRDRRSIPGLAGFRRGDYQREHPVQFGGAVRGFTLRVRKDCLTPVVDAFGENLRLLPNTMSGETVDVAVEASEGAMERWLLQQGDYLEAIEPPDSSFRVRLRERIRVLQEKYG